MQHRRPQRVQPKHGHFRLRPRLALVFARAKPNVLPWFPFAPRRGALKRRAEQSSLGFTHRPHVRVGYICIFGVLGGEGKNLERVVFVRFHERTHVRVEPSSVFEILVCRRRRHEKSWGRGPSVAFSNELFLFNFTRKIY